MGEVAPVADEAEEYIAILKTAVRAGYRSASNLHAAVCAGQLRTATTGPQLSRVTTQEWPKEFLTGLRFKTEVHGRAKGCPDSDDEAGSYAKDHFLS